MSDIMARLDQRPLWLRAVRVLFSVVLSLWATALILWLIGRAFEPPSPPRVHDPADLRVSVAVLRTIRGVEAWAALKSVLPPDLAAVAAEALIPESLADGDDSDPTLTVTSERFIVHRPRR